MAEIYLIRHSMTEGNKHGRYIGSRTDESLCEEGICLLEQFSYPEVEKVFVSPMKRCRETAEILFPDILQEEEELLKECDFGIFENKNYRELSDNDQYQRWIDSGGRLPFPGGECQEGFEKRCVTGFLKCLEKIESEHIRHVAFLIHGGTIMSILHVLGRPAGDYFSWQVKNGEGYHVRPVKGQQGTITLQIIHKYIQKGKEH